MIQKPIIHMHMTDEKIPFDVSLYRSTQFSRARPSDLEIAKEGLRKSIQSVLEDDHKVDNPVTRARGQIQLTEHATPEQELIFDQLRSIQNQLDNLDNRVFGTRTSRNALSDLAKGYISESSLLSNTKDLFIHLDREKYRTTDISKIKDTLSNFVPFIDAEYNKDMISLTISDEIMNYKKWIQALALLRNLPSVISIDEVPF